MPVDVVFAAAPGEAYATVSDDDFTGLLAARAIRRYRDAGRVVDVSGSSAQSADAATVQPSSTVEVVFTIQAAAGYVTVQRDDLPLLLAAGLVLRYRDGAVVVQVSGGDAGSAAYASSGTVAGRGSVSGAAITNAGGAMDKTGAGTVAGAGTVSGVGYSTARYSVTATGVGVGTVSGESVLIVTPQGKGEQGGKGNGGKGGDAVVFRSVNGRGTIGGVVTSTSTKTGYTVAGTAAGLGSTSGVSSTGTTTGGTGTVGQAAVGQATVGGGSGGTTPPSSGGSNVAVGGFVTGQGGGSATSSTATPTGGGKVGAAQVDSSTVGS